MKKPFNLFYQIISVILIPKLDKSSPKKESYRHIKKKQTKQNQ